MSNMLSAFVIMPFDEELESVYTQFIKPVLEEEGFDVERADDIESQQNILKDILNKIRRSDLIIADLTDLNPNVFYELGLAHAFRKPVLLLTQTIGDVPFDLKSYRLLEYSTHFAKIKDAREKLKSYAEGCRAGKIEFGSPVTDFFPTDEVPSLTSATNTERLQSASLEKATEEDIPGFLDHQIALAEGYDAIAELMSGATADMQTLTQNVENATVEANTISSNLSPSSSRSARNVFRQLANHLNDFNSNMRKTNTEYANVLTETEDSLEHMVAFLLENPDISESQWDTFYNQLGDFENIGTEAKAACIFFATSMENLPRIESRLNRAVSLGSEELRVMAANLERTVASVARAKQRIDRQTE